MAVDDSITYTAFTTEYSKNKFLWVPIEYMLPQVILPWW